MSEADLIIRIMCALVGIICFILGGLIWFKQKADLIAGYKPEKTINKKGLCTWIGFWTIITGLIVTLYPWIFERGESFIGFYGAEGILAILVVIVLMITGTWRYEKRGK